MEIIVDNTGLSGEASNHLHYICRCTKETLYALIINYPYSEVNLFLICFSLLISSVNDGLLNLKKEIYSFTKEMFMKIFLN